MEVVRTEVVVVGAGCAGLRAALEVTASAAGARLVCVTKHHGVYAGASAGGGGVAAPMSDADADLHAADTIVGSGFLADQAAVEIFVAGVRAELVRLEAAGCPWFRGPDGELGARRMGGMRRARAWFVRDRTRTHARRVLWHESLRSVGVEWLHEHLVTKLLVADGRACGVTALSLRTGQLKLVVGRAVIVATGGASQLFARSTGGGGETGDGLALAYRAGVALRDMELVQFHPLAHVSNGLSVTEAVLAGGARLLNVHREPFLQPRAGSGAGDPPTRNSVVRAMEREIAERRGVPTSSGPALELDLRSLDVAELALQMPTLWELADRQRHGQLPRGVMHVRPAAHGLAGGVETDHDGATSMPGLFVTGRAASSGVHGANALGGNALGASLVFARRAGVAALRFAREASEASTALLLDQASAEAARLHRLRERKQGESVSAVQADLQRTMDRACGPVRDARGLRQCLRDITSLKERYAAIALRERSQVFNVELARALELRNALDVAEAVAAAALERTESRGMHVRSDFPERDDATFLQHSRVELDVRGPRVGWTPVALKRWRPGEVLP